MSRGESWCWTHMKDPCIICERDQLKKIVKDAINYLQIHGLDPDYKGMVVNTLPSRQQIIENMFDILRRPIKPRIFDPEEKE